MKIKWIVISIGLLLSGWLIAKLTQCDEQRLARETESIYDDVQTATIERQAMSPTQIEDKRLNSGYTMPVLGLGTWTQDDATAAQSVYQALRLGYRLIDTARYYGNERGVGTGIAQALAEGWVTRDEIFVTSKIMPSDYTRAAQAINDSLADLGLDYLDLMLIHQPGSRDAEVYQAMEAAVADGKIRSLGISNYYTPEMVTTILEVARIKPAVIQNENHLYYQNTALLEWAKTQDIIIESWYPLGGRGHTQEAFGNPLIVTLSEKYGKTPAQIILRWQVQAGYVVIPGSSNPEHIKENIEIFDFALTQEEMAMIGELNQNQRYEKW